MSVAASQVDWQTAGDYEHITLTVAGPEGVWLRREFKAGQSASLSLVDQDGHQLPDGAYIYELRFVSSNAGNSPRRPILQAGSFAVRNGGFAAMFEERKDTEPPTWKAPATPEVIHDKLVTSANECIGPLCVAGDDAGFPVLRLKNDEGVGILFDDVAAPFSYSRNWLLQANPNAFTGNNLDNFFLQDLDANTIPFSVQGDAPDASLVVGGNAVVNGTGGNVGVGTYVPVQAVHVVRSNTPTLRLEQSFNPNPARSWDVGANHTELFVKDVTNSSSVPFRIKAGAPTDSLTVSSTGKVGIGTASPTDKLHLFDSGDVFTIVDAQNTSSGVNAGATFRAQSNATFVSLQAHGGGRTLTRWGQTMAGWSELVQSTGNGLIVGTGLDKPLILGTNSTNRMQITSTGDVGIGTTAPASKLHVNGGDIRVSGGSFIDDGVTLNAPDYVFEPSYSLMPLAELREFVSREKHLPNVPAAADIRKEGLNLSQFQMRLLEKVEELALYTLKQEENLQSLRDENRDLKARLEALEKAQAATEPK